MLKRMRLSRWVGAIAMVMLLAGVVVAQDTDSTTGTAHRGRKYKAPPPTAKVSVTVVRGEDGKPLVNAAVIFHPVKDGQDSGTLELKTDTDGVASIDIIPVGSQLRVQVIAEGYATYGQDYEVPTDRKDITVTMLRPNGQRSSYVEDNVERSTPGVQEPVRPTSTAKPPTPGVLPVPVTPKEAPVNSTPASTPTTTTPSEQKPQ